MFKEVTAAIRDTYMPILHYALGLRFGKVCEQKREQNARKTQLARVFT